MMPANDTLKDRQKLYRRCANAGLSVAATAHIAGVASETGIRDWAKRAGVDFQRVKRGDSYDAVVRALPRATCEDVCVLIVKGEYPPRHAIKLAVTPKKRIAFRVAASPAEPRPHT